MKSMFDNLAVIAANTRSEDIKMIDISKLHESDENFFIISRIEELAESILGQGGVKENLIVSPIGNGEYEIISGHRRRAAVQYLIDHGENVSRMLPCLVQNYEDESSKLIDLILMNTSARQLSDAELMQSYEKINSILQEKKSLGEKFGKTREKLAEILAVSSAQVGKMQNVEKNAIEPVKEAVKKGDISISTANEIAKLDEEQQKELVATSDISEVKPKEIKKKASKKANAEKVDTSINFSDTTEDDLSFSDKYDEHESEIVIEQPLESEEPYREKVDTNINFSDTTEDALSFSDKYDEQESEMVIEKPLEAEKPYNEKVDTNINFSESDIQKEHEELMNWANSLSDKQLDFLCDGGWYNNTIRGYLISAAQNAEFSNEQIKELLNGLRLAFSLKNKEDAEKISNNF